MLDCWPGCRALAWHEDDLYLSKGYHLYRIAGSDLLNGNKSGLVCVGRFRPDPLRKLATVHRLTMRLLRAGFYGLAFLPGGRMVAILSKSIAVLDPGGRFFRETWAVQRGSRPMGMAVTPEGSLFWGEYFSNPERDKVFVYGSDDGGETWEVVYTFPERGIRHVHKIQYDAYADCLWMLTGDGHRESTIIRVSKDWKNMETVAKGSQQRRAVSMIFQKEAIFYATDTPHDQNRVYRIDRATGAIETVGDIAGPSMWSTTAGGAMFFASAAEPGEYYYPAACIWGSRSGEQWSKLVEYPKDGWHPRYFQFGNMVLPQGVTDLSILAATPVATLSYDQQMLFWQLS